MSYIAKNCQRVPGSISFDDDGRDYHLIDNEGISHPAEADVLCGLLGFCGCGVPESALRFIRDILLCIDRRYNAKGVPYEEYRTEMDRLTHDDEGVEYTVLYLLTEKKLLEHGGSVPGWLTDLGRDVLEDLNALALNTTPDPTGTAE
jgi:hypothetical protein